MKTRKALAVLLSLAIIIMMFASIGTMTAGAVSAWAPNTAYAVGDLVTYNGSTYKCLQAHTSLVGWEPPNVPALWQLQSGTPAPTSTPTPTPTVGPTSTPTPTPTAGPTATPAPTGSTNIALGKPVTVSSVETAGYEGNLAVDGSTTTRWSTAWSDPQWIYVDLGSNYSVNRVVLNWEAAYATAYKIQLSTDAANWVDAYSTTTSTGGVQSINISGIGRYVRMYGTSRATTYGYSLWEFEVYGTPSGATPTPTPNATATPTPTPTPTTPPSSGYQRIGYLADWASWDANTIQGSKLTIINYAFAGISNNTVTGGNSTKLAALRQVKANNPGLKTEVSIGGWGAEGFHTAASTDANRTTFANSAVSYMKTNGFDGVDIDWEYPNQGGAGIQYGPEDKHNFTLLLQNLRSKLDAQGTTDGKHYLLSIAVGVNQTYIDNTEMSTAQQYVDYINLMTYDLHGGWDGKTGHHTALYTSSGDPGGPSVNQAVTLFKNNGVSASKLVVGCAFYGHQWNGVTNSNNGLWQPGSDGGSPSFNAFVGNVNANGYTRYWDSSAHAPYIFNGSTFVSYDDEQSIADKCAFVKSNALAGAMFWEYSNDTSSGTLLNALYNGLK